jgi:hypothetical protein
MCASDFDQHVVHACIARVTPPVTRVKFSAMHVPRCAWLLHPRLHVHALSNPGWYEKGTR